jgi:polyphosphate kinase 2 (PPK2 family)
VRGFWQKTKVHSALVHDAVQWESSTSRIMHHENHFERSECNAEIMIGKFSLIIQQQTNKKRDFSFLKLYSSSTKSSIWLVT